MSMSFLDQSNDELWACVCVCVCVCLTRSFLWCASSVRPSTATRGEEEDDKQQAVRHWQYALLWLAESNSGGHWLGVCDLWPRQSVQLRSKFSRSFNDRHQKHEDQYCDCVWLLLKCLIRSVRSISAAVIDLQINFHFSLISEFLEKWNDEWMKWWNESRNKNKNILTMSDSCDSTTLNIKSY